MVSDPLRLRQKKRLEQKVVKHARVNMHGYATGAYPRTDSRRLAQTGRLRFWAKENAPVCFRKESESTVSNEKPKRGSAPPPGYTFRAGGAPRNWLVPVVLLSIREWNTYGYELMERASAFGFEAMNPGTLYRTLRQMEKNGIVELGNLKGRSCAPDVCHHRCR